jgi:hypothetical protein
MSCNVLAREILVLVEYHTSQLSVHEYEESPVGTDICRMMYEHL